MQNFQKKTFMQTFADAKSGFGITKHTSNNACLFVLSSSKMHQFAEYLYLVCMFEYTGKFPEKPCVFD